MQLYNAQLFFFYLLLLAHKIEIEMKSPVKGLFLIFTCPVWMSPLEVSYFSSDRSVVFCCCNPSNSRFKVLCVVRCFQLITVVKSGNLSFCSLQISSNEPLCTGDSSLKAASHWMIIFALFSINCCVSKSQKIAT